MFQFFYDLHDVCAKMIDSATCPSDVRTAATAVQAAIINAVPYSRHTSNRPQSHGIAIDLSISTQYSAADYGKLQFAQHNRWSTWLSMAP